MADLLTTLSGPRGNLVFTESAASGTVVANVFAKTAAVLYSAKLDNSANATEAVYVKIYQNTSATASGLTVGTTNPIFVMKAPASSVTQLMLPAGMAAAGSNYLHMAVVTTAGVAGTTDPTGTVSVTLIGE